MDKHDKARSSIAQFLSKYIVVYSGTACILFLAGAITSFILFPNADIASFVMITVSGLISQFTDFANNLIAAENERKEKERDEKQTDLIETLDDEND